MEQPEPDELDLRERDAHVGAVGADAVRHDRSLLALHPGEDGAEREQHGQRIADVDEADREILLHHGWPRAGAASALKSTSASMTVSAFREARLEGTHDALEVRVVPVPLGLDAERNEDIRVAVLGRQVRIQENDLRVLRQAREIAAFAPDENEIRAVRESGRGITEQFDGLGRVRVLVRADQQVVLDALARHGLPVLLHGRVEDLAEVLLEGFEFFVRAPVRNQCHGMARGADHAARLVQCSTHGDRPAFQHRFVGAHALEDRREVAALVADPRAVHGRIFQRRDAGDGRVLRLVERLHEPLGFAVPDLHGAAARAARADRRRRLQVPDAGLVQELPRQQCADGADVDDVVRIRVFAQRAVFHRPDVRDVAAAFDAERHRLRHFVREARAAQAQDAALVVEQDAVRQVVELGRLDLRVARQRRLAVVGVVIVLQRTLAGLVADAAVHRMVQRDELQDGLAVRLHFLGFGEDFHAGAHGHVAGDVEAAAFDFDQAHAAVAGDREVGVPAEIRDEMAVRHGDLHDGLVRISLDGLPVYKDFRHSRFPSKRERLCSM